MYIKLILGAVLIACSTLMGIKISEKQKFKRDLFQELVEFSKDISTDIGVFRTTIDKKLEKLPQIIKSSFKNELEILLKGENIKICDKRLTAEENNLITNFFNSLGTLDEDGQKDLNGFFYEKFCEEYSINKKSYEEKANLYTKLGALMGVGLFVVII